jgi:hypothetical protein
VIEDPYLYPGTDCLRNRLGIRNADELKRSEAERTAVTLALLDRDAIPGDYELPHLQAFHRRIFGDIYDWAGKLRTVTIAKEHSVFALPEHIESFLTGVLELSHANNTSGTSSASSSSNGSPTPTPRSTPPTRSEKATAAPSARSSASSPTKPAITSPGNNSTPSATPRPPVPATKATTSHCTNC